MTPFKLLLPLTLLTAAPAAFAQDKEAQLTSKLEAMAASGSAEAAYHAGVAHQLGLRGTPKDNKKALEYFRKSAEGGDPLGAYKLGTFYAGQSGGVVEDDPELALQHKLVAAKAGYSIAQHDIAQYYYEKGDTDEAVKWLLASAQQGYRESLVALASLYSGEGTLPRDMGKSYAYLLLSLGQTANKAPEKARKVVEDVGAKLTPAEKKEANAVIAAWRFKPSVLTLHALSGGETARALVARARVPAKSAEVQGPKQ